MQTTPTKEEQVKGQQDLILHIKQSPPQNFSKHDNDTPGAANYSHYSRENRPISQLKHTPKQLTTVAPKPNRNHRKPMFRTSKRNFRSYLYAATQRQYKTRKIKKHINAYNVNKDAYVVSINNHQITDEDLLQIATVDGALIEPLNENYNMYMSLQFCFD